MIDHTNDCKVLDGECTCSHGEWDLITDNSLTQDPATAVPVRGRRIAELVRHTHITRDIKPRGECGACDEYWIHADANP